MKKFPSHGIRTDVPLRPFLPPSLNSKISNFLFILIRPKSIYAPIIALARSERRKPAEGEKKKTSEIKKNHRSRYEQPLKLVLTFSKWSTNLISCHNLVTILLAQIRSSTESCNLGKGSLFFMVDYPYVIRGCAYTFEKTKSSSRQYINTFFLPRHCKNESIAFKLSSQRHRKHFSISYDLYSARAQDKQYYHT